jgi:dipeptidyl aminopeptidase/acylaminoacyl peptidase
MARPAQSGRYPLLLWNRGGFGDRGAIDDLTAYLILASTAAWGYIVLATQYRGNRGSEGHEDWGGEDVNDAYNLLTVAEQLDECDTSRIGIEGASRGGVTTYRILTRDDRFRCAVIHAGLTDIQSLCRQKETFAEYVQALFGTLSDDQRRMEVQRRSAIHFVDRLPKTVPILLMHGTADSVVPIEQSEMMAEALTTREVPHEYIRIEGGGHVALKDGSYAEIDRHRRAWFDRYL